MPVESHQCSWSFLPVILLCLTCSNLWGDSWTLEKDTYQQFFNGFCITPWQQRLFKYLQKKKKNHVMIRYDNREKRSSRCLKWNHSFTVMFLVWFDFQTFLVLDHFIHTRLCKNKYISFIFLTHTHVSSVTGEDAHSTAAVGVTSPDKYRRTGFGQFWLPENEQAGNILGF